MSDNELAHLKSMQLKDQLRTQAEAPAAAPATAEKATSDDTHAANETLVAVVPVAPAPAPLGEIPTNHFAAQSPESSLPRLYISQHCKTKSYRQVDTSEPLT